MNLFLIYNRNWNFLTKLPDIQFVRFFLFLLSLLSFCLSPTINLSTSRRKTAFLSFQPPASAVERKYAMFTPCLNEKYIVVEDVTVIVTSR